MQKIEKEKTGRERTGNFHSLKVTKVQAKAIPEAWNYPLFIIYVLPM